MAFGQQSGPPASAKQVQYLQALLEQAGYAGFRDARGPLGLTQRQGSGKFTREEASALIDALVHAGGTDEPDDPPASPRQRVSAADQLAADRETLLRGMPAELLADELLRRGWSVTGP